MLRALEILKQAGKVKFVGFDTSQALIKGVRQDKINGVAAQKPFMMGYSAVKAAVEKLKGKKVPRVIDTGVVIVTKADLEKPEIKELINPPLKKYLDN
jgi:ribose transport system substrate-binding protein